MKSSVSAGAELPEWTAIAGWVRRFPCRLDLDPERCLDPELLMLIMLNRQILNRHRFDGIGDRKAKDLGIEVEFTV